MQLRIGLDEVGIHFLALRTVLHVSADFLHHVFPEEPAAHFLDGLVSAKMPTSCFSMARLQDAFLVFYSSYTDPPFSPRLSSDAFSEEQHAIFELVVVSTLPSQICLLPLGKSRSTALPPAGRCPLLWIRSLPLSRVSCRSTRLLLLYRF